MDNYKIRVKIGQHEFEAEGPADQVKEQFEAWKSLIASLPSSDKPAAKAAPPTSGISTGVQLALGAFEPERLAHLFNLDEKRDLVTLRIFPTGEDRHKEAVLLTLYGYLRLRNIDEVIVTKLKASIEASGPAPDRIDRVAVPLLRDGMLVKGGSGKGGKYRLTNKGIIRAEELIGGTLGQIS